MIRFLFTLDDYDYFQNFLTPATSDTKTSIGMLFFHLFLFLLYVNADDKILL